MSWLPSSSSNVIILQRAVTCTIAILLALVGLRLWFVDGFMGRVTIDGPSMAPALLGPHYEVSCADCGFAFYCDAEHAPADLRAVCPNCGFGDSKLIQNRLHPADQVLIDRWPLLWRSPRQGEVVAARAPGSPGDLTVKRVAGTAPGQFSISGGNLFLNGQIARKSPAELREVRVLVHDNDYLPMLTASLPARWLPPRQESRWQTTGTGFRHPATAAQQAIIDWLEYQHWPCTADTRLRGVVAPVRDNDSYNQGGSPRELNALSDVLLSCRVRTRGEGQIAFAARDGRERFEVIVEPNKRVIVQASGRPLLERKLAATTGRRDMHVEFGFCDQQVLLVLNGRTVVRVPYQTKSELTSDVMHPLAIGAWGLELEVAELRVWRDIYYLDAQDRGGPWEAAAPLAPTGVILLGDNPPVSIDSRHWTAAAIPASAILGRVYRPFWKG